MVNAAFTIRMNYVLSENKCARLDGQDHSWHVWQCSAKSLIINITFLYAFISIYLLIGTIYMVKDSSGPDFLTHCFVGKIIHLIHSFFSLKFQVFFVFVSLVTFVSFCIFCKYCPQWSLCMSRVTIQGWFQHFQGAFQDSCSKIVFQLFYEINP